MLSSKWIFASITVLFLIIHLAAGLPMENRMLQKGNSSLGTSSSAAGPEKSIEDTIKDLYAHPQQAHKLQAKIRNGMGPRGVPTEAQYHAVNVINLRLQALGAISRLASHPDHSFISNMESGDNTPNHTIWHDVNKQLVKMHPISQNIDKLERLMKKHDSLVTCHNLPDWTNVDKWTTKSPSWNMALQNFFNRMTTSPLLDEDGNVIEKKSMDELYKNDVANLLRKGSKDLNLYYEYDPKAKVPPMGATY